MAGPVDPTTLLDAPLDDLMAEAARLRDSAHGARITFSPKVFIPLTMLCRDRCGYCTFAKPPAHLDAPYLSLDEVLDIARQGAAFGCHEALFTLGEAPEDRYPVAAEWLAAHGYSSTVDYLAAACAAVARGDRAPPPRQCRRALSQPELERLRPVSPSQGMMIETLAARLGGTRWPARRRARQDTRTAARHPRSRRSRRRSRSPPASSSASARRAPSGSTRSSRSATLHERHGHVQEVIVQNFLPKPGTAMWRHDACDRDEFLWTIAAARVVLGADNAPAGTAQPLRQPTSSARSIAAGIDDWGGVSPVTPDHVNPERPWPALDALRVATEAVGKTLAPRLTVYPEYVRDAERWLDPGLRFAVLCASDSEGLARDDDWAAGGDVSPPSLLPIISLPARAGTPVGEVLHGVLAGEEVGVDEIVTLLEARGSEFHRVAEVADQLRREIVGDVVTFVRTRNINYTNICTFKCRFCAFSKGPLSLNLRGDPYLLDLEEIQRRVVEAVDCGATEVCLQGGIHPSFDGEYYLSVARAVKEVAPTIHVHGFTALEVTEGARRLGIPLRDYLVAREGRRAGVVARHRGRDPRRRGARGDLPRQGEHRGVARSAPSRALGRSPLEHHDHGRPRRAPDPRGAPSRAHARPAEGDGRVHRVRAVAVRAHGEPDLPPAEVAARARRCARSCSCTRSAASRTDGWVDNIQVSWPKCGIDGAREALRAGCNDLGGTLMDENISRAAGAEHGQELDDSDFHAIVEPLDRPLEQRTTLYGRVTTVGKRLRPRHDHGIPVTIGRTPRPVA